MEMINGYTSIYMLYVGLVKPYIRLERFKSISKVVENVLYEMLQYSS
jgi:hypothetical protein